MSPSRSSSSAVGSEYSVPAASANGCASNSVPVSAVDSGSVCCTSVILGSLLLSGLLLGTGLAHRLNTLGRLLGHLGLFDGENDGTLFVDELSLTGEAC